MANMARVTMPMLAGVWLCCSRRKTSPLLQWLFPLSYETPDGFEWRRVNFFDEQCGTYPAGM
jgi:hypothetical protein